MLDTYNKNFLKIGFNIRKNKSDSVQAQSRAGYRKG